MPTDDNEACGNLGKRDVQGISWRFRIAPTYLEGGITMANEIKVGKNESIDSALRRFKRMSQKAGTLAEVRKREHYEKPSVRRKKKSEAARKRKFRA